MNPMSLRLLNVGRFASLELDIPTGVAALTGPNGAGKSTILNSIEAALFADGSRDLAPMLGMFGDRMEIELLFEHDSELWRARQGYRQTPGGRGTATVDFEISHSFGVIPTSDVAAHVWQPLTRETADETRRLIAATIGLTRQTFHASAFLKQGNSGAFPEASPADRKAILGQILDPAGLWPKLSDKARADARVAADRQLVLQATISEREQAAAGLADVEDQHAAAVAEACLAKADVTVAEETLEQAAFALAANSAAAERVRTAAAHRDRAAAETGRARAEAAAAHTAANNLALARDQLAACEADAERLAHVQEELDELRRKAAGLEAAAAEYRAALQQADALEREAARLHAEQHRMAQRASALAQQRQDIVSEHAQTCDACGQTLGAEAKAHRIETLTGELDAAVSDTARLEEQQQQAARNAEAARAAVPPKPPDAVPYHETEQAVARLAASAALAPEKRHALQVLKERAGRADELDQTLRDAAAELAAAETRLAEAAAGVADDAHLAAVVNDARLTVAARRRTLDDANAAAARLDQQVEQTRQLADGLPDLRADMAALNERIDLLRVAEKAYGRDGIPALIAENVAVPYIEDETNRILEQWPTADGSLLRVEIHTQKQLKTADHLRETLLILVAHDGRMGDYLTFSGGERSRLSIALRVALAKLLANRRGAESRLLVIDEPDALDAGGMEALAVILGGLSSTFDRVLVVSHNPLLASAFEQTVEVVKAGGVSRVSGGDRELVQA